MIILFTIQQVVYLKQRLADPKLDKNKLREYLLRLLYVELLGHDASFGHINAVKLCSDPSLVNKKVAYLTTCLFLSENSELLILLMNTMKSDLHSDNYLIVCASLETVCHLATEDALPLILPSIKELLTHNKELVRKKAVMALHRFYLKASHMIEDYGALCRKVLCDHDPSVMGAALCALYEGIKKDPAPFKNLVKSLLHVLSQIIDRRLPKSYDNHRAPAPFLQIKLLKMLALLGQGDKASSSQMHPVILSCLKNANSGTGIGNALVYECVRTAIAIHPDAQLLSASAAVVAHFLNSSHGGGVAATAANNLKYVALDALGGIVQIDPSYGEKHQLAVIDCLEDPDETLKKKTLELLYRMTTTDNVEIVVDKMLTFLEQTSDEHIRADVATRVTELAEQYAPDNYWFIETMNKVFELAGDLVRPELADDLMQLIAEGTGESEEVDSELRRSAVESYVELLSGGDKKKNMPKLLLLIVAWVLGEYGTLCLSGQEVMELLVEMGTKRQDCSDSKIKAYVITALCKQASGLGSSSASTAAFIEKMLVSKNLEVQQRAIEFMNMMSCSPEFKTSVMPKDASCEEIGSLEEISSVSAFVQQALQAGAAPYMDRDMRGLEEDLGGQEDAGLDLRYTNIEPEPIPLNQLVGNVDFGGSGDPSGGDSSVFGDTSAAPAPTGPTLNVGTRKWGRPAQPQQPPPSTQQTWEQQQQQQQPPRQEYQPQQQEYQPQQQQQQEEEGSREQRDLAAKLFGGGGGRSARGSSRRGGDSRRRVASQQAAPTQAAQPVASTPAPMPDLLDLGMGMGAAAAAPPPGQASDLDMLMGLQPTNPTMPPQQQQQQPAAKTMPQQKLGAQPPKPVDNDPFKDLLGL